MNLYLSHHGIKGQKWGVRRYQNADGSLTAAGKKRYRLKGVDDIDLDPVFRSARTNEYSLVRDARKKESGITETGKKDFIKKGAKLTRYAGPEDAIDDRLKYVSVTDSDAVDYEGLARSGALRIPDLNVNRYEYQSSKNLKVAGLDTVEFDTAKSFLKKYSGMTVSEVNEATRIDPTFDYLMVTRYVSEFGDMKVNDLIKNYTNVTRQFDGTKMQVADQKSRGYEFVSGTNGVAFNFLNEHFEKNISSIAKSYKKKGYDAMVDLMDSGLADYPVILLDPKSSITLKSKSKYMWEDDTWKS